MNYSKNEINKAGVILSQKTMSLSDEKYARKILEEFRAIHIEALKTFRALLVNKTKTFDNILISQRLKRTPSIVNKLKINKTMSLSRMQDVGGLRIVCDNLDDVYKIKNSIRKSEKEKAFKSKFVSEKDYIQSAKESGYRSIHLIYKFNNKCLLEIQIRNKIQHAWATAVEVAGLYFKQPLKQSFGDTKRLDLFKKISKAFNCLEKGEKNINLFKDTINEIEDNRLLDKIKSFNLATNIIDSHNHESEVKGKYFLLQLNFEKKILTLKTFATKELNIANEKYSELESENKDNPNMEIVLVSVEDINKLKKLYPNYFLDTEDFLLYIDKIKEIILKNEDKFNILIKLKRLFKILK